MGKIEIDNVKILESILGFEAEVKTEDLRNNPTSVAIKFIRDAIKKALEDQGLEYKDGKLNQIENEPKQRPLVETEYDPYSLPVWDESNLPRMDESKYHPCTEKKDKPETEEMAYFKKAIADIVDYSRKHPDITPEGFVDRFMEHLLDIARLALNEEKSNQKHDVSIQINPSEYINDMGGNGCYLKNTTQASAWSEEDEINLGEAIWYVENPAPMVAKNAMLVEWLKNLKDRLQPQPKREWSEEAEKNINQIETILLGNGLVSRDRKELVDWLKTLRPQSHWKPSDDMIMYLERAIEEESRPKCFQMALNNLLKQLKKLREE